VGGGIRTRTLLASGVLAVMIVAAFLFLFLAIANLLRSTDQRRQARESLVAADALEELVINLETGLRGFVITGKDRFLEPWRQARAAFPKQARALEALVADDPVQLTRVRRIVKATTSYIHDYSEPLVKAVRRHDPPASSVQRTEEGKRRVDGLRTEFASFASTMNAVLTAREVSAAQAGRRALVAGAAGLAGSVLLIVLFAGYLTRAIVGPVRTAAAMAGRLAGGDLRARVQETGVDEIGALERSFNTMAKSLEANQEELQTLLEEQSALRRTATLVAQAASPSKVFEAVTGEVGVLFGADLARMERFETDGTVTGVAGWGMEEGHQLAVGSRFAVEGVSIAALVQQTGRPARVDTFANAAGAIAEEARELGIRSSVGCPIVVAGRLWGVIAASRKRDEAFPTDTESRIADFTELVATAIANAEGRAELAASRVRIVEAADGARKRIERDLHDGIQQRLVSLGLDLRTADLGVPHELGDVRTQLSEVGRGLESLLDELREISRGIHPAILSEGGLNPALKALARRSPVPVKLDLQLAARLPERIEVAAYYVASEALANAAKHARASVVKVDVRLSSGALRLAIRDDGLGGADPSRGSGLIGLIDRVEAMQGTLVVDSPMRDGTSLLVEIPIQVEDELSAQASPTQQDQALS
jgi:signal transduction histidine kinase